jgi:surfactin synthase thioesterase subunit
MIAGANEDEMSACLICCPYGGGSSFSFRGWRGLHPKIKIVALDYPGRLLRRDEPTLRDVTELARFHFKEVAHKLRRPFAFLGVSLGALVGFELARLAENEGLAPRIVIVGACMSPDRIAARKTPRGEEDIQLLKAIVKRYRSKRLAALGEDAMNAIIATILRTDIVTFERFGDHQVGPIRSNLLAVYGANDRLATHEDMEGWRNYAGGDYRLMDVPGDHFFIESCPHKLRDIIRSKLVSDETSARN